MKNTGKPRLDNALQSLGYANRTDSWSRAELVAAIRKFAVLSGDLEMEYACDMLIQEIPNVIMEDGNLKWTGSV